MNSDNDAKNVIDVDKFEKIAFERIMSSTEGRALMMRYLGESGVFDNTFNVDPYTNAYNCGTRAFGLRLQSDLMHHTQGQYLKMIKESTDER